MDDFSITVKNGTMTSEGFIHHLHRNGINMPVLLDVREFGVRGIMQYQRPQRGFFGKLLYALPGGVIFTGADPPKRR